jgi:hypothetical protein
VDMPQSFRTGLDKVEWPDVPVPWVTSEAA